MSYPDPTWRKVGLPPAPDGLQGRAETARERAAALRAAAQTLQSAIDDEQPAGPPVGDLLVVHADAEEFYRSHLAGSGVSRYLHERGVDAQAQQRWSIGYAPAGWTNLTEHLRRQGHDDALIEASGLARYSAKNNLIDLFRDRAMFPVRDPDGTTIAFVGRAAPGAIDVPKYINSPDTAIYHKKTTLYGLAEARPALAAGARPVIVEGVLDAIAVSRSAPLRYAGVALGGVALSSGHVAALARASDLRTGVLMALDPDTAGQGGMVGAYAMLTTVSDHADAAVLPRGSDPAHLLQTGGHTAVADALDQSRPLADLVVNNNIARWDRWLDTVEGNLNAMRSTAKLIATMPPGHVARQVARLAERLTIDHTEVTAAVVDAVSDHLDAPKRIARRAHDLDGGRPTPLTTSARAIADMARPGTLTERLALSQQQGQRAGASATPAAAVRAPQVWRAPGEDMQR